MLTVRLLCSEGEQWAGRRRARVAPLPAPAILPQRKRPELAHRVPVIYHPSRAALPTSEAIAAGILQGLQTLAADFFYCNAAAERATMLWKPAHHPAI
jgi:hypothetical protein